MTSRRKEDSNYQIHVRRIIKDYIVPTDTDMAKELVESLGGKMWKEIEAPDNRVSTWCRLPLKQPHGVAGTRSDTAAMVDYDWADPRLTFYIRRGNDLKLWYSPDAEPDAERVTLQDG